VKRGLEAPDPAADLDGQRVALSRGVAFVCQVVDVPVGVEHLLDQPGLAATPPAVEHQEQGLCLSNRILLSAMFDGSRIS
jgi:hypothetical protein